MEKCLLLYVHVRHTDAYHRSALASRNGLFELCPQRHPQLTRLARDGCCGTVLLNSPPDGLCHKDSAATAADTGDFSREALQILGMDDAASHGQIETIWQKRFGSMSAKFITNDTKLHATLTASDKFAAVLLDCQEGNGDNICSDGNGDNICSDGNGGISSAASAHTTLLSALQEPHKLTAVVLTAATSEHLASALDTLESLCCSITGDHDTRPSALLVAMAVSVPCDGNGSGVVGAMWDRISCAHDHGAIQSLYSRRGCTAESSNATAGIRRDRIVLAAHRGNECTRRDSVQRFSMAEIVERGANVFINADHFMPEIAYKLGCTPKYGA